MDMCHDIHMVAGKVKKPGKRGRKPAKIDKERKRDSFKQHTGRYPILESVFDFRFPTLIYSAVLMLFMCLQYKQWCLAMDQGKIPSEIKALLTGDEQKAPQSSSNKIPKNGKYGSSGNSQSKTS
uniref:Uncharacterized protein n=1 Tax=Sinocyclocheilus grahami TaxID=75366 RepID=A0A672QW32_SINGR